MTSHPAAVLGSSSLVLGRSYVDRIDPRTRIITAVAFSVLVAVLSGFAAPCLALALAVLAAALARLRLMGVLERLAPVNALMLLLVAMLPWAGDGRPLVVLGPFQYTREGFLLVASIAVKANAIVLTLVVLLAALDIVTLGHALSHLWVPDKLTHLFLFTVRYLDVLGREYLRLRAAMKMRAFRPAMSWHTCRSYGYLAGMLLVRSVDRSERILAAMKCRGFRGRFYLMDHFSFSWHDAWFAALSAALLAALALVEWL
jgi:cobalt/nickel transport system permease protein